MKESIRIKNLGPLKDIYIPDIKPLTVLIGESGSGKSLLMKTLILFRYYFKMINIRWYLKNSHIENSPFELRLDRLLPPELKYYFSNPDLEVDYSVNIEDKKYKVWYHDGSIDRSAISRNIPNQHLLFLKESWISELRNFIPQWIDSERNTTSEITDFYFKETFSDFIKATKSNEVFNLNYIGMSLNIRKVNGVKKYLVSPQDDAYPPLEWKYTSSGVQTSSSIITIAEYFARHFSFQDAVSRSILYYLHVHNALSLYRPEISPMDMKKMIHLHLEEPELNLFPTAQCSLMEEIIETVFHHNQPDRTLKLIMATHSPYIVNFLNVLTNRNRDNLSFIDINNLDVYRIYDGILQPLIITDPLTGRKIVETYDLTEDMERIYQEYKSLTRQV